MKVCLKKDCSFEGKPQPLENFTKQLQNVDGKSHSCKSCQRVRRKIRNDSKVDFLKLYIG